MTLASCENVPQSTAEHSVIERRLLPPLKCPPLIFKPSALLLHEPLDIYLVLAAARRGHTSCYLKHEDKLRVSQSVSIFYLLQSMGA